MKNKTFVAVAIAGIIGAATAFLVARKKKQQQAGTPPKAAPQLHLTNPGDQSEFPSAPESERDLG
ncbi:MAG: hypothetical protein M3Q06_03760 [Bacteroidota bacterium]|nr:hypothetical protein [Bacteroidota bacterium]